MEMAWHHQNTWTIEERSNGRRRLVKRDERTTQGSKYVRERKGK
jgi:hypothetical protein